MGAIDLKTKVLVKGHKLKIHILGEDTQAPALIFVHGGPGIPNRQAVISKLGNTWAKFCSLVTYDQRGCGGSYYGARAEDMTLAQMVEDLDGIVDFTLETLKVPKVFLLCGSWGTVIGINYLHAHPEKVAAYIGSGQMVNGFQNEAISYEFAMNAAQKANDTKSIAVLESVGPPVRGCYRPVRKGLRMQRQVLSKYGGATMKKSGVITSALKQLFLREMSLSDKLGSLLGYRLSMDTLWEAMIDFDFNQGRINFDAPLYILQGRHDYTTPSPLIEPWFDKISAPVKQLIWFEESAHGPLGEEMEKYTDNIHKIFAAHSSTDSSVKQ